jgi:solute:Na+ symporter, SSS family
MLTSVLVMNTLYWPPKITAWRSWWMDTFGGELFWPWFTLIGVLVTLGVAWTARLLGGAPAAPTAPGARR